jgi:transposase
MPDIILTRTQRSQLRQQLKHTKNAALYRRTLAILQLAQGKPLAQVANALRVTRQTVYNWIEAYTRHYDPLALSDAARSGRPATWTPDLDELVPTLLKESPMEWGYTAANWTVPLLGAQFASWDGGRLSPTTIRRRLHDLGYVWKRTRYVLPPDPELEKKKTPAPTA